MKRKLDSSQVTEIYESTDHTASIAKNFNVSKTTVNDIKSKRIYTDVVCNFNNPPGQNPGTRKKILTEKQIEEIYYFTGTAADIKNKFGCSINVARNIKFGVTYQKQTELYGEAGDIKIHKLAWDDVCSIRASSETSAVLSKRYKISSETVRNIRAFKTRKYE